jgi:hypothetical protein
MTLFHAKNNSDLKKKKKKDETSIHQHKVTNLSHDILL